MGGMVFALVADHPADAAICGANSFHCFRGLQSHAPVGDVFRHGGNVPGQVIAAQVFLADEQKIDAMFARLLANGLRRLHVGGIHLTIHAETGVDGLGFLDQAGSFAFAQKLGEVGFTQFVDEVELTI